MTDAADWLMDPAGVAAWLHTDIDWVLDAIGREGMPVLGYDRDGAPVLAGADVQAWLRRPRVDDDET